MNKFLANDNIKLLWDVIIDEDMIKKQPTEFQENIFKLFTSNINGFYEIESIKTTNLVDMNKKYILLILNHVNKMVKSAATPQYKKIKILDEEPKNAKDLITYEEIHNDKKNQFDKDLNKRQEEFKNAMALPVPPVPEFTDKFKEEPISEIEKVLKEMTAQRNYDVEQISKGQSSQATSWLKSQETSLKSEKIQQIQPNIPKQQDSPKKNVTWGENETWIENETESGTGIKMEINELENNDDNIFKLFKKIPTINEVKPVKTIDDEINTLKNEVKILNNKLDTILELLKKNK